MSETALNVNTCTENDTVSFQWPDKKGFLMYIKVKLAGARGGLGPNAVKFPHTKGCSQQMKAALSS